MTTTRSAFLAKGRRYEGTKEGRNNVNPFTKWLHAHGFRRGDGEFWCADYEAFLDYVTGNDVPSYSASTLAQADAYKRTHRWGTDPVLGAKAFFFSPAEGRIGHMGHVVAYTGSTVTIQSGNTSAAGSRNGDRVATKVFQRHQTSGFRIVGYGLPRFAPEPHRPTSHVHGNLNRLLKLGNAGGDVARVQHLVGVRADGSFGPITQAAVKRWQRAHHLTRDGEFGPKSCRAAGWTWKGKRVR